MVGAGKSCIIRRLVNDTFSYTGPSTIGLVFVINSFCLLTIRFSVDIVPAYLNVDGIRVKFSIQYVSSTV